MSLLLLSSTLFASLILLRKFTLILPGRHSSSHKNKSSRSLYIFLKPWCMKVRYFKLTWWYASILLLILCFFDSGLCQGYFVRLKKMWVDNNIRFSTSILCTKKIISNYCTAHWRWKWTECHSVFLLTSISCWTILYNRKRIKNKRIKLKPSLTETRTKLLQTLFDKTTDNEKINFCYTGFNGNIKICLKKHKEKSVYEIENMDKFIELMNDMTSSNEQ